MDLGCGMHDSSGAARGLSDRLRLSNVAMSNLNLETVEAANMIPISRQHADRFAALDEQADHVVPDQTGRAGDESEHVLSRGESRRQSHPFSTDSEDFRRRRYRISVD
jgi:hypothetical protein